MTDTAPKKRGSGSNKSRRKKREYQAHVRARLAAGSVNNGDGSWMSASSIRDGKVRDRAEKQAARLGR